MKTVEKFKTMSRVGRFFVSTNGAATEPHKGVPVGRGAPDYGSMDKAARKRLKKYGIQYMNYPQSTIHEETSPMEGEVRLLCNYPLCVIYKQ